MHTQVYTVEMGEYTKINKKEKKISYKENEPMNDTHVMKEQHKEDVKSKWWDRALQGLAQRSGSAGNYNHNHIQCTSRLLLHAQ